MAFSQWGQPSSHNGPFRLAVSEVFILLSLASDTSTVSSSGFLSPPSFLSLLLCLLHALVFSVFQFLFHSVVFTSVRRLSFLQSVSSLCSSASETQDPSQMGLLINSRLRVTYFGLERENQCMHGQRNSCCCLPLGVLQQERTKCCFRGAEH